MEIKRYDKLKKGQRQLLHDLWDELLFEYWDFKHNIPINEIYNGLRDNLIARFAEKDEIILKDDSLLKNQLLQWMFSFVNQCLDEEHNIQRKGKTKIYTRLSKQIPSLITDVDNKVGALANVAAALKEAFGYYFWVGFYIVKGDELELGPFQGPVACYAIKKGKGVCGTAWEQKKTIVVPDVEKFPGHIACSSKSRSEIVVPVFKDDEVVAVIDVDSTNLNAFDDKDKDGLEAIAKMIEPLF